MEICLKISEGGKYILYVDTDSPKLQVIDRYSVPIRLFNGSEVMGRGTLNLTFWEQKIKYDYIKKWQERRKDNN